MRSYKYNNFKERSPKDFFTWIKLIFLGLLGGVLAGIASVTNSQIDPNGLKITFFTFMCQATKPVHGLTECGGFIALLSFLSLTLTLFSVLKQAVKLNKIRLLKKLDVRPWIEGLFIYLTSMIISFFILRIIF